MGDSNNRYLFFQISGGYKSKNKILTESLFLWKLKRKIFLCLLHFWWLQESLACGSITLIVASIFMWPFFHIFLSSTLRKMFISLSWTHLNPGWFHLEIIDLITHAKFFILNKTICKSSRECIFGGLTIDILHLFNCLIYFLLTICSLKWESIN